MRAVAVEIEIGLPDGGRLTGAVARPGADGSRSGVVVIHEVFGDQPEMRAVCDRFAARGYVAVMPDLFSAGGLRAICLARAMTELSSGRPGRWTGGYIEAARAWLAAQADVHGEQIAVIGFCMGGGFALLYLAGGRPGVRVAAINYGQVPKQPAALRGACPIVASYGARDRAVGRPGATRLRHHLEELGIEHDVKLYDEAGHCFMTDGHHPLGKLIYLPLRIGYVPDVAEDAWQRVFEFFDSHLQPAAGAEMPS
jgi:carboxymethylenebutenolidase